MEERDAYIALNMMEGAGPVTARLLATALGSAKAIMEAPAEDLRQTPGVTAGIIRKILDQRGRIDIRKEVSRASKLGMRMLTPADEEYPAALKQIHDPPLTLYIKGALTAADRRALAVVGTRRPTFYGRETATRLVDQLARAGWTIISGLARGIDTTAHQAALTAGGRTLAVLGGALDRIYPPENADLAENIAGQGAVISEFPLGRDPDRTTFPMRNRIVSGLSMGILVVEAGDKSGALITANQALEQGRSVMAVPGRVDSSASRGTHQLIKAGARLVETLDDINEEFEFLIPSRHTRETNPPEAPPDLTGEQHCVLAALREGELDVDTLIRRTGIQAAQINVLLLGMEMRKLVKMLPGRLVAASVAVPDANRPG